ncbi:MULTISPECIES: hypothetical protein [unclassified Agarivorans]|uniref:hypothetical protein n=1 Tax=unclassified Agarivorans TaxID=2636026 RepID=UPI0026E1FF54|nr:MULTISPECIES: hypothetical protein [unclassified Agarivorans]MDO6684125.1 hypothetical protein [Agarivorans sp. 3_MG-2023]MDO6714141.1 hypothetical protein [Agarivorans sp. 2_MG-2023]
MKNRVLGLIAALGLSACALTGPTVDEVTAAYKTELNAPHKETIRENIIEDCAKFYRKEIRTIDTCYMKGDVIVYETRLTNNRWQWNPQAASTTSGYILKDFCTNPAKLDALKHGFGLLVNLTGKNGFVGKVKSYKDCQTL